MKNFMTTMLVASFFVALLTGTAGAGMVGVQYSGDSSDAGFQELSTINLDEISGRGFPVTRDLPSDLSRADLEGIVGRGFVTKMTATELEQVDGQGLFLPSPKELLNMTQDLVQITVKGVKIIIDKSNITESELTKFVDGWEEVLAKI